MQNINLVKPYLYESIANAKKYVEIEVISPKTVLLDHMYALPVNDTVENLVSGFEYEKVTDTKYKVKLDNLYDTN
jgi:hypothetical protein